MEFAVLGPLRVTANGRALSLGGRKLRTLLAILACNANQVVTAERLLEALWDGAPPRTAAQNLRGYVYHLRRNLGNDRRIAWRSTGYQLAVGTGELDADLFEDLARRGRQALAGAPDRAAALLHRALQVWRGPALADLRDVGWLQSIAARLEEHRLATVEIRTAAELALGHHADLVGELTALAAEYPLRENITAQLMLALGRSSRRAEALGVYRQARQVLVDELGVEPGHELRRLHAAILAGDGVLPGPSLTVRPAAAEVDGSAAGPAVIRTPNTGLGELRQIREALQRLTTRLDRLEAHQSVSRR